MHNSVRHLSVCLFQVIFLLTGLVFFIPTYAQNPTVDSLNLVLKNSKEDTVKVNLLYSLSRAYGEFDPGKSAEFLNKSCALARKLDYKKGLADNWYALSRIASDKGDNAKALSQLDSALEIREQLKDKIGISDCLTRKGLMLSATGDFTKALEYQQKGLALRKEVKNETKIGDAFNGIGNTYMLMGNYEQSINYYMQALKIYEKSDDRERIIMVNNNIAGVYTYMGEDSKALEYYMQGLKSTQKVQVANAYNNIGTVYLNKKMYTKARENFFSALTIQEALGNPRYAVIALMNIGESYSGTKEFGKALEYNFKALELAEELEDPDRVCGIKFNIALMYYEQKDFQKALEYSQSSLQQAKKLGMNGRVLTGYLQLADIYKGLSEYKKALESYQQYTAVKDTMFNIEKASSIAELQTKYETDKKEKEIQLLTKDNELKEKAAKEQRIVRISLIGGLFLLLVLSLVLYNRYRFKQQANALLESQKRKIEKQNTTIIDSIDYAKTIQEAILPSTKTVEALFPESFILYKPKAIVSGDFYWFAEQDSKIICAVADCTGHGVPGAFMSMLGNNILQNVVQKQPDAKPAAILDSLNEELIYVLTQEERSSVKNGMDIALIAVDQKGMKLEFAGAQNSLYMVRDGQLSEIKADRFSIGSLNKGEAIHFSNHSVDLRKDDMIYLFSDGYPDQIGGPYRKKFYYQPFKDLLISISQFDVQEQQKRLDETITNWKASYEQTDDILVIGIRC